MSRANGRVASRARCQQGRVGMEGWCPRAPSSPRPASQQPPALCGAEAHLVSHLVATCCLPTLHPPSWALSTGAGRVSGWEKTHLHAAWQGLPAGPQRWAPWALTARPAP